MTAAAVLQRFQRPKNRGFPARRAPAARADVAAELRREAMRVAADADRLAEAVRAWDGRDLHGGEPEELTRCRRQLREAGVLEGWLRKVASQLEGCSRDRLEVVCRHGHVDHVPRRCDRPDGCEDCARVRAARLRQTYQARALELLAKRRRGRLRLRGVTLSLQPLPGESLEDSWLRCRDAAKALYRVLWGAPHGRAEGQVYRQLLRETAGLSWAYKYADRRPPAGGLVAMEFGEVGLKPHAHMLVLGGFVDQRIISRAWWLLTGNSFIAFVRKVPPVRRAIAEVVKYPFKFGALSPRQIVQCIRASHRVQLSDAAPDAVAIGELMDAGDVRGARRLRRKACDRVRAHRRLEALGVFRRRADDGEADDGREPRRCTARMGRFNLECGERQKVRAVIPGDEWLYGVRESAERHRFGAGPP